MTTFIRGESPVWFWVNTSGMLVDDTYYAFFLTNDLPYLPQNVYQDPNGIASWPNPIEFQSNAGLPDNLYFDPSLTYRIEIRRGPTQSDPLIGNPIQNYIPGNGSSSGAITDYLTINPNLISNPQFSDIVFNSPYTFTQSITGNYAVNVGVGWQLVLVGFGTVILTQNAIAGDNNNPENPPYSLTVTSSGSWSSVQLVQTLQNNGALFANGAVAASLEAYASTNAQQITVVYDPITGTSQNIFQAMVATGGLTIYSGYTNIDASTNALTGTSAYVNFLITLPNVGTVTLTNIQLTGQSTPVSQDFIDNPVIPLFQEQSYNQIVNGEFYLYRDPLKFKPIPSYLVGWDFPLNPAQFYGDSINAQAIGAGKSFYAWDQTIVFQSVDSGVVVQRAAFGELQLTAAVTGQFAIIQYLPQIIAREALNNPLCVNISALTQIVGGLGGTVSIYYTKGSLPSLSPSSNNSLVLTLDANGKPATFNGTWIEVPKIAGFDGTFTIAKSGSVSTFPNIPLTGWDLQGALDGQSATFMAIVVGFKSVTSGAGATVGINSVSLQAGSIPTIPAPQTLDDVIRECQYYYEQSYANGAAVGTITQVGVNIAPMTIGIQSGSGNDGLYGKSFYHQFQQEKYAAPQYRIWSPVTGAENNFSAGLWSGGTYPIPTDSGGGGTNPRDISSASGGTGPGWTGVASNSTDSISLICNNTSTIIFQVAAATPISPGDEGILAYHYTLDATLGGPIRT